LTDQQLDFESDRREWSILFQLSHMASLIYRWLIIRWGETLFPNGSHGVEDVEGLAEATDSSGGTEDRLLDGRGLGYQRAIRCWREDL